MAKRNHTKREQVKTLIMLVLVNDCIIPTKMINGYPDKSIRFINSIVILLFIWFFLWKSPNSQGLKATLGEGYTYDYHQGAVASYS